MKSCFEYKYIVFCTLVFCVSCQRKLTNSFHVNTSPTISVEASVKDSLQILPVEYKDKLIVSVSKKTKEASEKIVKLEVLPEASIKPIEKNNYSNKTNKLTTEPTKLPFDAFGIIAFVLGVLSPIIILASPVALIFGIIGLTRNKKRGTRGKGFAIMGIVLGALVILFIVLALLFFFFLFF